MRMKKAMIILACALALAWCKKEKDFTITNLSGKNWYEAQVWFSETGESGGLIGSADVGNVAIGESCTVEPEGEFFYIYANDYKGDLVMSKMLPISGNRATVEEEDMY